MGKSALIIATDGTEESELVITVDLLRRSNINTTIVNINDKPVIRCALDTMIHVDKTLKEVLDCDFDAIILPGGPGSNEVAKCPLVSKILKRHERNGKIIAAICGGPKAIKSHGIAHGGTLTSFPPLRDEFEGYNYVEEDVCMWKNLITSRAPGTAFGFALKLVEQLEGMKQASCMREKLLIH